MPRKNKQRLRDEYDKLKIRMREYGDEFDDLVADKPRESLLVSFGAGALVGAAITAALLRRRS